ncbi:MAG TPA: hypothetical protein DCS83_08525 [Prevotella sp.]|nr:hypothetical protein [Prevotella sp.]
MNINRIFGIKIINGSLDDEKEGTRTLIYGNGGKMPCFTRFLLKTIVFIKSFFWDFLLVLKRPKQQKKKYYFCICATFKDEKLSLKQWVEYHKIIGVDHFYLYNNNSTDKYMDELQTYIDEGIVDLINWPMPHPAQLPAYMDCFMHHKNDTQWIAFIDLDEYICPIYKNNIKLWIKKYENYPSVYVYWKIFGDSGRIDHDLNKPIIEQYFCSWDRLSDVGKTFVNTNFEMVELKPKYLHEISCYINFLGHKFKIPPINEFRKYVALKTNRVGLFRHKEDFTIQINHYVTKSYGEYVLNKRRRGPGTNSGETAKILRSMYAYYWHQRGCISCDFTAYKYLSELKVNLGYADHVKMIDNAKDCQEGKS